MKSLLTPTVEEARSAYRHAWYGFCLAPSSILRFEQLQIMDAMRPFCALIKNGREWQRFTESIPGYMAYLNRRRREEGVEE